MDRPVFATRNGFELARLVVAHFQTHDPFELAARAGVSISYAHWHPVSWGEFDERSLSICLNTAAPIPTAEVLAHELGHYFSVEGMACKNRANKEKIAEEFALFLQRQPK